MLLIPIVLVAGELGLRLAVTKVPDYEFDSAKAGFTSFERY